MNIVNIVVEQRELARALRVVGAVFHGWRPPLPVLGYVLLRVEDDGRLTVAATDREVTVGVEVECAEESIGELLLPWAGLGKLLQQLPAGRLRFGRGSEWLRCAWDYADDEILDIPAAEATSGPTYKLRPKGLGGGIAWRLADGPLPLPLPRRSSSSHSITRSATDLYNMLRPALAYASTDDLRPEIQAVRLRCGETLEIGATDGFRLLQRTVALPRALPAVDLLLPRAGLRKALRALRRQNMRLDLEAQVELHLFQDGVEFRLGKLSIFCRALDTSTSYPSFASVIREARAGMLSRVVVDRPRLIEALNLVLLAQAGRRYPPVHLDLGDEHLVLRGEDEDQAQMIEVTLDGLAVEGGAGSDIRVNGRYLLTALWYVPGLETILEWRQDDRGAPLIIRPAGDWEDHLQIMMPAGDWEDYLQIMMPLHGGRR